MGNIWYENMILIQYPIIQVCRRSSCCNRFIVTNTEAFGNTRGTNINDNVTAVFCLECFKRTTSPHLSRKWAACWDRSFRKGLVPSLSCKLHSIFSNLWQFVLTAPTCSHVPSAPLAYARASAYAYERDGPPTKFILRMHLHMPDSSILFLYRAFVTIDPSRVDYCQLSRFIRQLLA